MVPDRWNNVVLPLATSELASVGVLRVKIKTGSAKIRTVLPSPGTGDADMSVWRGVFPIYRTIAEPVPTPDRKEIQSCLCRQCQNVLEPVSTFMNEQKNVLRLSNQVLKI